MRPLRHAALHSNNGNRRADSRAREAHSATAAVSWRMALFSRIRALLGRRDDGPPPPTRLPSGDELALLARPQGEPEALMLQEMLASSGIVAMIKNRDAFSVTRGAWGGFWAYELWVLRRDLARAREIIGEDAAGGA